MKRIKRKKVQREWLENQLAKYERRIQKLADIAYRVRQAIDILDAQEEARNIEKGGVTDALYNVGIEATTGAGQADQNTGESNVSDSTAPKEVLGE